MSNKDELSETMQAAVEFAKAHGGKLKRFPGGFWCGDSFTRYGEHYGTPTVQGLVSRGVMRYTEYQAGRNGKFPIVAELEKEPT